MCLQIAKELETDRIRVEEEVLATARIATQLEGRLQSLHEAKEAAERALSASETRAAEARWTCIVCCSSTKARES